MVKQDGGVNHVMFRLTTEMMECMRMDLPSNFQQLRLERKVRVHRIKIKII